MIESELLSIRIFNSKSYTDNQSREVFITDSVLKTTLRKKCPYSELFWYALSRIFPRIQSKCGKMRAKITLNDLAAKKDFIDLKAEVDKLDINKLTNVPTSLNNLKTKVDDLDVGKLKTVHPDLKKLSGVVDNEVVKKTKFNTLKTKKYNLEKKIPDATTLIHINQYNR